MNFLQSLINNNMLQIDIVGLAALFLSSWLAIKQILDARFRLSFVNPIAYLFTANGGEKLYQALDVSVSNYSSRPASLSDIVLVTPNGTRIHAEGKRILFYRQEACVNLQTGDVVSPACEEWTTEPPIVLPPWGALRVKFAFQLTPQTIKSLYDIDVGENVSEQFALLSRQSFGPTPNDSPCSILVFTLPGRPKHYNLHVQRRSLDDVFDVAGIL